MRCLVLCLVAACSQHAPQCLGSPSPGEPCNSCPFSEGEEFVACGPSNGQVERCELSTWEHDCECTCGSDGWWTCDGTFGSECPHGAPPVDGGIPPDAVPLDAAVCSRIEAENIGVHPGWAVSGGTLSNDFAVVLGALDGHVPLVFDFTGTTLALSREVGPNEAPIDVSIDGAAVVVIDGYSATDYQFVTSPVASGLANTTHHASVVCEGTTGCSIDYFDVSCL